MSEVENVDTPQEDVAAGSTGPGARTVKIAKIVAVVAGALGALLAVIAPILPVSYTQTELKWPQATEQGASPVVQSVAAPNVSYVPVDMDLAVPCRLAADLPKDGGVLLSTVPAPGEDAGTVGLFVRATADRILVTQRNAVVLNVPRTDAQRSADCRIVVHADTDGTRGAVEGLADANSQTTFDVPDPNSRPQIIGVYTDLPKTAATDGLSFHSTVDTRFISSPTTLKGALLILGVLLTIASIVALAVLDARDGKKLRRMLARGWWRPRVPDVLVTAVLIVWLFIGGNTADDGYQVTVGRIAPGAGYLDNYYRYFGVPQDPFGWHYQYLSLWMQVSTSVPWLRLLPLLFGLAGWFLISRFALPRLGRAVRTSHAAYWAAALAFLAVWLPFNNGLRVEPAITVGVLATWILVERGIATGRLVPWALAIIAAALTLTIHPVGAIAAVALLAGLRPLIARLRTRSGRDGWLPMLVPLLASGLAVLYEIFADQTIASIMEGVRVQGIVGPTNKWWNEGMRYYVLLNPTPDGSIARRIGIFVTILAVLLIVLVLLSRRRVPGVPSSPLWRLVAVTAGAVVVLAFVPTKATHQLGAIACLTGVLAAAATAMVRPAVLTRRCNRTFFAAAAAYALAVAFAGRNQWWYVGSYGIPWADDTPHIGGVGLFWPILAVAVAITLLGVWQYYRDDQLDQSGKAPVPANTGLIGRMPTYSLSIVCAVVLLFTFASFAKAARSDSWTWTSSNIDSFRGKPCALAEDVLVEADPNEGLLVPANVTGQRDVGVGAALAGESEGFAPDGVSAHLDADAENSDSGSDDDDDSSGAIQQSSDEDADDSSTNAGSGDTGGGTVGTRGVNGSAVKLPFGLDQKRVPVLGTYGAPDGRGHLTSDWYGLPERSEDAPLVTMSVAGQIEYIDDLNVLNSGQKVRLEFGRVGRDGAVTPVASMTPLDAGGAPEWRNLRFPLKDAPPRATVVRIVADDVSPAPNQWVAVTPPRVTNLTTVNSLVGSEAPVLLDWEVALAFPCQRPAAAVDGVLEVPEWRITPDAEGERVNSQRWMAGDYGGPLGITQNSLRSITKPGYLRNAWAEDWGSLRRLVPLVPQVTAELEVSETKHNGLWTPGPMRPYKNSN
ncbi:arabinosyltransferase domain-containing protein [Gordonia liuliyuniae]|uniref:Arabinosyltransferase domain-containing protein n=1 Tax=Gordonia liuliyuniae TaxID=2911517 RepID=A0ABS9ITD5_9ACTN|nr:arabinosyltransferase domain-containing protein [Gordonia liuliyuniae]MCF8588814.1 arabinosyltransferase domain-containing protein [Gordonia liuliyuniae]